MTESGTRLHYVYYRDTEPPRHPHSGEVPPTDFVRLCFREPFREGSSHTLRDLMPVARLLNEVMRRTLLLRVGYREGLTRIELWLVSYLIT